jgi:hypothetical protein
MQVSTRFFHKNNYSVVPVNTPQKGVPDVYKQAQALGGTFTRITKGLPLSAVANFSPSILKHHDKTYIAWRSQPEPFVFRHDNHYNYENNVANEIYLGLLHDDETVVGAKRIRPNPHRLSYEDPRLFIGPDDELYIQFVASSYASKYDKKGKKLFDNPKVIVCHVNEMGEAVSAAIPPIGKNLEKGVPEKNWCFFPHEGELCCLYSTRPLVIERENSPSIAVDTTVLDTVTHGAPTFNSLPPIELIYGNLIFYHWKHMAFTDGGKQYLIYHLGAYLVDKKFSKVTHVIKRPLFTGSLNDRLITWTDYAGNPVSHQPAVILPFGAYIEGVDLVMSLGVNDAFIGIMRCPMENISRLLEPV